MRSVTVIVLSVNILACTGESTRRLPDARGTLHNDQSYKSVDTGARLPDNGLSGPADIRSAPVDRGVDVGSPEKWRPCSLDVSKVDTNACDGTNSSGCDGVDIAHNYVLWPDPYACYVCGPGVTLLSGSACQRQGIELTWNSTDHQCILNGQGYPMSGSHGCSNDTYDEGVSKNQFNTLVNNWQEIQTKHGTAVFQPNAGADAYVIDLVLEDGRKIKAALSMGHGVLDGKCGATFLVKANNNYVLLLQTDVRSWSLELSPGANTWLNSTNVGGTCIIPQVRRINASFVTSQFLKK